MELPSLDNPVAGMAVRALLQAVELQDKRHDALAIRAFAREFAEHYRLSFDDVLTVILGLSDNLLESARTPQGVTVLGFAVASDLGTDGTPFMSTIH